MKLEFTISGNPITKKNSQKIIKIGNRPALIQSDKYRQYERAALLQIPRSARCRIHSPVNVKAVFYRDSKRRVDLTNLQSALMDILTAAGVLADDNRDIAAANDGSRVYYDKQHPRTEVTISLLEEEYAQWTRSTITTQEEYTEWTQS